MTRGKEVLFIGDSLVAYQDWQPILPDFNCHNFGVPGETVAGLLAGLPNIYSRVAAADYIMVMIGTNNLVMADYAIWGDYGEILDSLGEQYPQAEIAVVSLLPLQLPWLASDAVARMNVLLADLVRGYAGKYLNLYQLFFKNDQACFLDDGVHLSDFGYQQWQELVKAWLAP